MRVMHELKVWKKCPEIRGLLQQLWWKRVGLMARFLIVAPFLILLVILSILYHLLGWVYERLDGCLDWGITRKAEQIRELRRQIHEILPPDVIKSRIN